MNILFNKSKKVLFILVITLALISVTSKVFAATTYTSKISVGDKLKFTGYSWCVYKTQLAANKLDTSKLKRYLSKNTIITVKAKSGNVLQIGSGEYICYGKNGDSNFTKITTPKTTNSTPKPTTNSKQNVTKTSTETKTDVKLNTNTATSSTSNTKQSTTTQVNATKSTTSTTNKTNANAKTFTIKYLANGGNGKMSNTVVSYGNETKLRKNAFTKKGYDFVGWVAYREYDQKYYGYNSARQLGWYSKNEIKTKYIYKNETKVDKTAPSGTVTMTAQWKKSSAISDEAMKFFAGVIFAEAGGEKDEGQRGVAYVIKNRMNNKITTNQLIKVLIANGQFSTVRKTKYSGDISYTYNGVKYYTKNYSAKTLKVAKEVMAGTATNPIGTRRNFWAVNYYKNNKKSCFKNAIQIGGTVFFNYS